MNNDKVINYFLGEPSFVDALDHGDQDKAMRIMRQALKTVSKEGCETATHLAYLRYVARKANAKLTEFEHSRH